MSTILVVDDEPKIRELLLRFLQPAGYDVKEAGSAPAALEVVKASGADVVLSDIQMPGHDGVWLVTMLRAQFPEIPIVLATAKNELPGSVTLQDGVVGYVLKPFDQKRVLKAVAKALAWRQKMLTKAPAEHSGDPIDTWLDQ